MHLPSRQDGVENRDKVYWYDVMSLSSINIDTTFLKAV